ncbi:MAG: HPF/RaiA family ribosome-associated protein [Pseudomonas sp.]
MQIQVFSDNRIENSSKLVEWAQSAATSRLQRFDEDLTRVTVHINDENGEKAGAQDKRCQIEARARGLQPISVTHKSDSERLAVEGALDKLHAALTSQLGKLRNKRPNTAAVPADTSVAAQDALLEEDYGNRLDDDDIDVDGNR